MFAPVAVPLWLLVLIVAFATVAFLSHFLFPSVRWFFRRRMERAVVELNRRLDRPIQPFKLMARNDMIIRVIHDPKVMEAVVAEAAQTGEPETVVLERARRYAREIVPSFSATLYFGVAMRLARWLARLAYRVRVGKFDAEEIRAIDRDATVVFVMNHRSNMDYVLVTHLAASRSALSYAVGEWAHVWPLSALIRAMGAYFIRRRHNSALYRRVLARYVQLAVEAGVTQAVFPEGGLSLDGRVGAPRLGILSYIVGGYRPEGRDVVFIPVALAYDRVLEDRVLIAAAAAGERRFRASVGTILAFLLRNLWKKLRGRFRRFGYAAVGFGTPVSLGAFLAAGGGDATERLAAELMDRICQSLPVLPVPLVAAAIADEAGLPLAEVLARSESMVAALAAAGAEPVLPPGGVRGAVEAGIDMLVLRRILRRAGDRIEVAEGQGPILGFYAAGLRQHADAVAAAAAAAASAGAAPARPPRRRRARAVVRT
ncbi:MAG: 1-acyl-sn-glycerol-3-phosphate acyltransferase [Rhodobacteraceae bacterium]|nr:1-acyl-sn-glycerol-3-phosphate acyltransferase [Paracoccaceae bacterium]